MVHDWELLLATPILGMGRQRKRNKRYQDATFSIKTRHKVSGRDIFRILLAGRGRKMAPGGTKMDLSSVGNGEAGHAAEELPPQGPKARDGKARAEGPGTGDHQLNQACRAGTDWCVDRRVGGSAPTGQGGFD